MRARAPNIAQQSGGHFRCGAASAPSDDGVHLDHRLMAIPRSRDRQTDGHVASPRRRRLIKFFANRRQNITGHRNPPYLLSPDRGQYHCCVNSAAIFVSMPTIYYRSYYRPLMAICYRWSYCRPCCPPSCLCTWQRFSVNMLASRR